jgi:type III pantothenate kinase
VIFCVDVGNSAIKCAMVDETRIFGVETVATPRGNDVGDLALTIRRATGAALSADAAAVSSVVPELTYLVCGQISECIAVRPIVVSHEISLPMEVAIPLPASVGADRLCAAVGALEGGHSEAIIIDAGSAITVDIVREGRFLGGVIMPGPATSLYMLSDYARQLPRIEFGGLDDPYPDTFDATETSMVLGASLSATGGIIAAVRFLESRAGRVSRHVVTGGLSGGLMGRLPGTWTYQPELNLRGLYRIGDLNIPR